jgi:hypothetical protein
MINIVLTKEFTLAAAGARRPAPTALSDDQPAGRDLRRSGPSASREYSEYVLLVGGFKFIRSAMGVRPTADPALDPC